MASRGFAAALLLIASCAHAKKEVAAEAPAPAAPVAAQAPAPQADASAVERCTADEQCPTNALCISQRCVPVEAQMAECHASAHFDFDSSNLHDADLPKLRRVARCLKALQGEEALIEGNCDERGTVQYNIALGFRRSHTVSKYLEELGTPAASLSEVSYGKELPLCTEATESCWAMNRRADVTRGVEAKDVSARVREDERREREASTVGGRSTARGRLPPREQPAAAEPQAPSAK